MTGHPIQTWWRWPVDDSAELPRKKVQSRPARRRAFLAQMVKPALREAMERKR